MLHINNLEPPIWRSISAWFGHIPFGTWLIGALKPNVLVELGVHTGTSYFAFCQAISKLKLKTKAYGVDTWRGNPNENYNDAWVYYYNTNNTILDKLIIHNKHYGAFSQLLPMTFEQASHIIIKPIDLLHIDGSHDYKSVRSDFETWLPKMSDRGIILFHDIAEVPGDHEAHIGPMKLWHELIQLYPNLSFNHSCGLGVLFIGQRIPEELLNLINNPDKLSIFVELANTRPYQYVPQEDPISTSWSFY